MPMEIIPNLDSGGTSMKTTTEEVVKTNYGVGAAGNSFDIIPAHVSGSFPDDIVMEILSRLPVKPLMQFKSVCKDWQSLIKYDRHFIDLHCNRLKSRPNLLYINPLQQKGIYIYTTLYAAFLESESLQQSISCAEIVEGSGGGGGEEEVQALTSKVKITDDKWFLYNKVLEPVNGLVCFVDWKTYAIKVFNASTREETPWVKSTLLEEENGKLANENSMVSIKSLHKPVYRFGFDPEKKEHKVFCFWRLMARRKRHVPSSSDRPDYESWEALTVGRDTKWRRINVVPNEYNQIKIKEALPPDNIFTRQVYADGTIYWSNKEYYEDPFGDANPDDPDVIVAFDVGSEKYRVIPIPDFILDEPRDVRLPIGMLVLGVHVALVYRIEPYVLKLWMLDDGADNKLENCRGSPSNWIAQTITLPFRCNQQIGVFEISGSTDKILFECRGMRKDVSFSCLYAYDFRKKTFKKIEMDGVSSFNHHSQRSIVTTFTESLFPVSTSQQVNW